MRHQLFRHLFGQSGGQAAPDIDRRQFRMFACIIVFQLIAFELEIGLFCVRLGMYRHIFASGHRHGPGDQPGNPGDQQGVAVSIGGGDPQQQAGCGQDAIIGAEHRRPQPAGLACAVAFQIAPHLMRCRAMGAAVSRRRCFGRLRGEQVRAAKAQGLDENQKLCVCDPSGVCPRGEVGQWSLHNCYTLMFARNTAAFACSISGAVGGQKQRLALG